MNATCAFWLKYHSSLVCFLGMTSPLAPVDFRELQQKAVRWALENPGCGLEDLPSPVRRESSLAAAAFSVLTARDHSAGRAVGAQPCDSCGRCTQLVRGL